MYEKKNIKILARFLLYLIALASIFLYGIINTYALETKTIYAGVNNGTLTVSNKYNYGVLNQGGTQSILSGNVNTTISGVSYYFGFYYYDTIELNKTYTLVINFMDNDLLNSFQSGWVKIQTCYSSTCNDTTLVSVVKNNNSGNSNKLTINFNPISVGSYVLVRLSGDNNNALTGINTFGIKSIQTESTNASQDIIDNQTNNTNNIINNNNSNTQDIIDNQNSSSSAIQDTIQDNLNDCYINLLNKSIFNDTQYLVWSYYTLNLKSNTYYTLSSNIPSNLSNYLRLFTYNNTGYADETINQVYNNHSITVKTNSDGILKLQWRLDNSSYSFSNYDFSLVEGEVPKPFSNYNEKICTNKLDEQINIINDLNDSINNDDIGGASQDGADFILDFDTNTFGLTSIVTAPLNLIQSLTSSSCSELELPLPFLNNKKLKLPCMTTIYQNTFGTLFTLYQTITFGIIAYWVCVRIFNQVKDFKNPEHDEIEVVDL